MILHGAPIDPHPYFNPYDFLVMDTNVSIKWNPEYGELPRGENRLNDISPAAGGPTTAPDLNNLEPGAGGQPSSVACANSFLANVPCAP